MGNACCCCCAWLCPAPEVQQAKGSKRTDSACSSTCRTKLLHDDDEDAWFEHDKTPLISSQHDADADDTQVLHASGGVVVKKTVVMRSPKAVHFEDMERRTETRVSAASSVSSSSSASSSARGLRAVEHHHRRHDEIETPPPRSPTAERRSPDSSSSSSDDFERVTVSPDVAAAEQHDRMEADDREDGGDERERDRGASSPRSPRSPGRQSSETGSPKKKKERYGRKNYRANSSRKKNL
ncbi:hypothetical protein PINS_up002475 [Pythium insidiosum]|nr:hypothetical protein PINS_up002475 [Pythium insidiosum]